MAELKKRKKGKPLGSLAQRVLAITVLLLVIPLFLQTLFLYRQEYEEKLLDVEGNLQVFAKERAHFIEEMIKVNWLILQNIPSGVTPQNSARVKVPEGAAEYFVVGSSKHDAILAAKKESDSVGVAIVIPFSKLIEDLSTTYPVRLAIIDKENHILAENMPVRDATDRLKVEEVIPETSLTLQLTIPQSLIRAAHLQSYYFHFATLVFFVGILGGGAVLLLTSFVARPLKNLCKTMDRVSQGALHARYTPQWIGFEINELGAQFNQTIDDLLHHVKIAENERLQREKLAAEWRIGHQIQSTLFPTHVPGLKNIDMAARFYPASEVNGDFYDFFWQENGHLFFIISDTAGHGISACLYSLGLRSIFRSFAKKSLGLNEIVLNANDLFWVDAHEPSMFSTAWIGSLNPKKKELTFCSQGHPAALLKRGGEVSELWTAGIALGAQKVDIVETKKIVLQKEDVLLLYTDGVIEAHDGENRLFGKERLVQWLQGQENVSAQHMVDQLIEKVRGFAGEKVQHDDITAIVMKVLH